MGPSECSRWWISQDSVPKVEGSNRRVTGAAESRQRCSALGLVAPALRFYSANPLARWSQSTNEVQSTAEQPAGLAAERTSVAVSPDGCTKTSRQRREWEPLRA